MREWQRGSVFKHRNGTWGYRFRDHVSGRRPQRTGYRTKREAADALTTAMGLDERPPTTLGELVDQFLGQYHGAPASHARLSWALGKSVAAFGDLELTTLHPAELGAWRKRLAESSPSTAHQATSALRQVLATAVRWGLIPSNPATLVPNPLPKSAEIVPFEGWSELEMLDVELGEPLASIVGGTGLRPEEFLALEWRDIDRRARVLRARRTITEMGGLREYGKTDRSRRTVPIRARVMVALDAAPRGLGSSLVFPAAGGGHRRLRNWRRRVWKPACEAADLDGHRPYDLRHTYATMSIAAGVSLFMLARRMGTSVEMIDRTYGHLTADAAVYELELLDTFDGQVTDDVGGIAGRQMDAADEAI
jgi:integrase